MGCGTGSNIRNTTEENFACFSKHNSISIKNETFELKEINDIIDSLSKNQNLEYLKLANITVKQNSKISFNLRGSVRIIF